MDPIQWTANRIPRTEDSYVSILSLKNTAKARAFHESFPQYSPTPLVCLNGMARVLGLKSVFVKDESPRFGLNAFKALGGSFAMARYIAETLHQDISELPYPRLIRRDLKERLGPITFFTATDGNHGRGVAWAANHLGQKAVVHMPKGSVPARFDNIAKEGAKVTIEEENYDECVRIAAAEAKSDPHGVIIQDTAWEGYQDIPAWIMQGYGTMAAEAVDQLHAAGVERPTHVFIQAGVGSLAGAVQGYLVNRYPDQPPVTIVMEAQAADCLYRSAEAADGNIRMVDGDLSTMMAGLACGEPNPIAWDILRNHAAFFASCPDWVSAKGMRMLAAPVKGDPQIISGESGAVGMGLLDALTTQPALEAFRRAAGLDENSVVLLFSTEGDTDPENYRSIVWGGMQGG